MSDELKQKLEQQLWNIADTLRGRMNADEFRDYILGFIFYKYLSEKIALHANRVLQPDNLAYLAIDENTGVGKTYLQAIEEDCLNALGFFLKPSELFSQIAKKAQHKKITLS